jgi:hypothetical protein
MPLTPLTCGSLAPIEYAVYTLYALSCENTQTVMAIEGRLKECAA